MKIPQTWKNTRLHDVVLIEKLCKPEHKERGDATIAAIKDEKLREPNCMDKDWQLKVQLRAIQRAQDMDPRIERK